MNLEEYNKVKDFSYREYCDYLITKYGRPKGPYYTAGWSKNKAITRTKEGLYVHHIYEDYAILLGNVNYAMNNPYEWQLAENLVYCDLLEHLFLHILIFENPAPDHNDFEDVGIGGVINFMVLELNDVYSGWKTKQEWRMVCHSKVINDKDVYFALLKRFDDDYDGRDDYDLYWFERSYNEMTHNASEWNLTNDTELIDEIVDYLDAEL